jgi:hypothetical protein
MSRRQAAGFHGTSISCRSTLDRNAFGLHHVHIDYSYFTNQFGRDRSKVLFSEWEYYANGLIVGHGVGGVTILIENAGSSTQICS